MFDPQISILQARGVGIVVNSMRFLNHGLNHNCSVGTGRIQMFWSDPDTLFEKYRIRINLSYDGRGLKKIIE